MTYRLVVVSRHEQPLFGRRVAAQLAGTSVEFLRLCEEEGLVRARAMADEVEGYSIADICQLACLDRLHQELEKDLASATAAPTMRRLLYGLMIELDELKRTSARREEEMTQEVLRLRRLLTEAMWRRR